MSTAREGRRRSTSRSSPAKTLRARGSTLSASVRPTTEISELWAVASRPAARISSPPSPKVARPGPPRRSSAISRAPCRSPDASPATTSSSGGVTAMPRRASRNGSGRPGGERIHQPGHQQAASHHAEEDLEEQLDLLPAAAAPKEGEEHAHQERVEDHQ